jgi:hypothetical protein
VITQNIHIPIIMISNFVWIFLIETKLLRAFVGSVRSMNLPLSRCKSPRINDIDRALEVHSGEAHGFTPATS